MKTNDPMLNGTLCLELWRHDDEEDDPEGCHVGLYYRSNGKNGFYEMHLDEHVFPLHPEFPYGFAIAAHCLQHIAQDLYEGMLVLKPSTSPLGEVGKLIDEWKGTEGDEGNRQASS